MKLKTLAVAVAILAVLAVAAAWFNRTPPPPAADSRVGQPLADPGLASKIARLRVSDQGKTVELVRQPDATWRVPGYYDFPADFSKVSSLVSDLTAAKIQRLVTTNPERIARLGFDGTRLEFLDGSGQALWTVTLGRNADTGGRFVRFGAEPKAYLADLNSSIDAEPKDWADSALTNLKADDIAKVEIGFEGEPAVTASRTKAGEPWTAPHTPAGQQVSADKISSLLNSLDSLRFTDTADPKDPQADAARQHERTFRLTTFGGQTTTVALGRKPEEKKPAPKAAPAKAETPAADKSAAAPPPPPAEETIPAGPVYASVTPADAKSPLNALMAKRAFQIDDYLFTGLPQKAADLYEPAPAAPAKK
ncbi:MAG TPA: DUF4340 domain-containing protein [Opitutaceae bacterium]|jgi:hypothetical protein|nr:DUF4340 domain-containing protein [Opitutaceae bacterium]